MSFFGRPFLVSIERRSAAPDATKENKSVTFSVTFSGSPFPWGNVLNHSLEQISIAPFLTSSVSAIVGLIIVLFQVFIRSSQTQR